ncbi:hypothetical protein GCM10027073_07860 [Streptomyces chlorus]|uniref:Uncharacterized protein n=1 Tax=Streptomyces chlorus TaxID=887452 RepID=A0ABW1DSA2_9ACTN
MGERRNDGGTPGRRGVHPDHTSRGHRTAGQDGPGPGPGSASAPSSGSSGRHPVRDAVGPYPVGLEALLVEALAQGAADAGSEQRAVAAFREARDAGAHRTRTRRRDDWRPGERRLGRFSVKAALSILVAGLGLGGVAVAGIGATGTATDGSREGGARSSAPAVTSLPSEYLSEEPSAGRSPAGGPDAGSGPTAAERPFRAKDTEAHCRAYEKVEGRGKALESAAWKRLVEAAGGAANVEAHCAGQVRSVTGGAEPGGTGAPGNRPGDAGNSGNGSGGPDNGASGRRGASARPGGEEKP